MDNNLIYSKPIKPLTVLKFTLPTVAMLVFTAIYAIVDGMVVAQFVGSNALSSINIVFPLIFLVSGIGMMLSTGGSAVVARKMGEGKQDVANSFFTTLTITSTVISLLLSLICIVFSKPLYKLLGANEVLLPYCLEYGTIMMLGNTLSMLQILFQIFFVAAGKPHVGLILTIVSGISNMILDVILVGTFNLGISGAAIATVFSYGIGSIIPLFYFFNKKSLLHFAKPKLYGNMLIHAMANGSSEMVTNLASSITTFLFNIKMMELAGEKGVAAITSVLYMSFLLSSALLGFSAGVSPLVSYHYGAGNHDKLKKLFSICLKIVAITSITTLLLSEVFAVPCIEIFTKNDTELLDMAVKGLKIFALSFLLSGFNIFASGFFTALGNGKVSAGISFLRTLILQGPFIVILPYFMGINGVWAAVPLAELLTLIASSSFLILGRKKYNY